MKYLLVLCVVVAAVVADEKYDSKYDNIDLDEILGSERLLKGYVDCVLERGKCTGEGNTLKGHMNEGLSTGCAKCTEKQKAGVEKVIHYLIENKLSIWNELCAKYDPEGKWRQQYEKEAEAKGIKIPKK